MAEQGFGIEHYFDLQRVTELALSSDGKMIAYAVERPCLERNRSVRTVYIRAALPGAKPEVIEVIQPAHNLTWISGTRELAFLANRSGSTQVLSYDHLSRTVHRYTKSDNPVTQFRFAPDGRKFAYITRERLDQPTLYEQMHSGETGIVIDTNTLGIQHFLDANWRTGEATSRDHLWVASDKGRSIRVPLPGNAQDFHWASNSNKLSVTYKSGELIASKFSEHRTSVGIFDVKSGKFSILADAETIQPSDSNDSYAETGWHHGEDQLIIQRSKITDLFVSTRHPEWTIVNASQDQYSETQELWHELSLTGADRPPLFHPLTDNRLLINKTLRGGYRSLYEPTAAGGLKRSNVAADVSGKMDMLRFSANSERAVFVNESFTRPPEIYLWQEGERSTPLTELNKDLTDRRLPVVREVRWESEDGTQVQGWLLLPDTPLVGKAQWPLITFVHGGPSLPMPAGFASHFQRWPYPFEVYALNGMAVFIPNYRGNTTFGRIFAEPKRPDREPVDDVLSGIAHVLDMGWFDEERLAISGHSHGAWLGPLVMIRAKIFKAGSFAEGAGNKITSYDLLPGTVNHNLHDPYYGASLYDEPDRYVELSPALHFRGLHTPVLFEAGNESAAIYMMSYPKAAKHAGMPAEYIIYPNTGHNPSMPKIQKESAERNLHWFRFWLQGYEDPAPEKADQYRRWHAMREEQRERLKGSDAPP